MEHFVRANCKHQNLQRLGQVVGEICRKNKSLKEHPHKTDLLAQEAPEAQVDGGWQGRIPLCSPGAFSCLSTAQGTAQPAKGAQGALQPSRVTPVPSQSQDTPRGSAAPWSEVTADGSPWDSCSILHPAMLEPPPSPSPSPGTGTASEAAALWVPCQEVPRPREESFKMLFMGPDL